MKIALKLGLKLILSFCLILLPFWVCRSSLNLFQLQALISGWLLDPKIEINPEDFTYLITILPSVESVTAQEDPIEIVAPLIPQFEHREGNASRIFLYNTHQTETYSDGVSIYEVTIRFAQMLEANGFEVVFESSNFLEEAQQEGLQYNQLYTISRKYINEAFVNYGGFDLVMDVHRDSCDRSVSLYQTETTSYAKLMFVVGMKSSNAEQVMVLSKTLTDKMRQQVEGIMREPFERQSVYNQDMFEKMVLLEVGGDQNTSQEALNSLTVMAEVLKEELQ